MDQGRVSVSYARALLSWAISEGVSADVYAQSKRLYQFICENPDFEQLLCTPALTASRKQKAVNSMLSEFTPHLTKLILLIIKKRREGNLRSILLVLQKLYRENFGIAKVTVESANALSDDTIQSIAAFLKSKLSKEIEIEQLVNQDLIGGFTLTINDRFMDKSVKGELELFHRKLLGIV